MCVSTVSWLVKSVNGVIWWMWFFDVPISAIDPHVKFLKFQSLIFLKRWNISKIPFQAMMSTVGWRSIGVNGVSRCKYVGLVACQSLCYCHWECIGRLSGITRKLQNISKWKLPACRHSKLNYKKCVCTCLSDNNINKGFTIQLAKEDQLRA